MAAVVGIGAAARCFLTSLVGGTAGITLLVLCRFRFVVAGWFFIQFILSHISRFKLTVAALVPLLAFLFGAAVVFPVFFFIRGGRTALAACLLPFCFVACPCPGAARCCLGLPYRKFTGNGTNCKP